jgi:hypothetical protein
VNLYERTHQNTLVKLMECRVLGEITASDWPGVSWCQAVVVYKLCIEQAFAALLFIHKIR